MTNLTIGRIRGLQEITTPDGLMTILALDQRGSIVPALGLSPNDPALYQKLRDFKLMVVHYLLPAASAVLLDPQYAAAEAVARGAVPGHKGLIVTLEKSGYVGEATARRNQVLPGWSLARVKRMGASAAKLLCEYNPEAAQASADQDRLVAGLVEEARAADLPLLVEPVVYSDRADVPKQSAQFAARRPALVIETARRIGGLGVDVLKVEFPHDARFNHDERAWAEACAELNAAAPVPWVLLSAGVDYPIFRDQVKAACQAGASGFVAGRAIWKEALTMAEAERETFLRTVGAERMAELAGIVEAYGRPWTSFYPDLAAAVDQGWMSRYP
jgi:tagatose 1,6-diphosphate aldolase